GGHFPRFPVSASYAGPPALRGSLHYFLLPYLEQDNLYKLAVSSSDELNGTPGPKVFICPSDDSAGPDGLVMESWTVIGPPLVTGTVMYCTNYAANHQVFGSQNPKARIPATFKDGTSNTIVFAERYAQCVNAQTGRTTWA